MLLQAFLPMHHTLRLGVAVTELNLESANSISISEALVRRESQQRPSVLFIWSINECLTRLDMGLSVNPAILMPGRWHEAAGELGLLKMSSCRISPILVRMLNAKFNRTREYASRIEHPISYNDKRRTKTIKEHIKQTWNKMTHWSLDILDMVYTPHSTRETQYKLLRKQLKGIAINCEQVYANTIVC